MKKIASFTRSSLEIGNGHLVRMSQLISCLDTTDINVDFYCEYEQTPQWFLNVEHTKIAAKDFFEKDNSNYDLIIYDSYLRFHNTPTFKNKSYLTFIFYLSRLLNNFNLIEKLNKEFSFDSAFGASGMA